MAAMAGKGFEKEGLRLYEIGSEAAQYCWLDLYAHNGAEVG